jgi:hypothetical protein
LCRFSQRLAALSFAAVEASTIDPREFLTHHALSGFHFRISLMSAAKIIVRTSGIESGIDALSRAAQAFQLTRMEQISYWVLMISADIISVTTIFLFSLALMGYTNDNSVFFTIVVYVWLIAGLTSVVALLLSSKLLLKLLRKQIEVRRLGLTRLSKSLWKESRRGRWTALIRGFVYVFAIVLLLLVAIVGGSDRSIVSLFLIFALLVISARYIRYQRERIELGLSATKLKQALERLREHAGQAEQVSVPSELLEQAARIESVTIAKERDDAVLRSVAARPSGFAIRFNGDAAEQRAQLNASERMELEDMAAQLSTQGRLDGEEGGARPQGDAQRREAVGERVAIDYLLDEQARSILLTAIRRRANELGGNLA